MFDLASILRAKYVRVSRCKKVDAAGNSTGALQLREHCKRQTLSLFHVMCYLNSNAALLNTFKNVYQHLNEGGIFIFDCWFGPGVLTDPPVVRVKRLENTNLEITRIAEPELFPNEIADMEDSFIPSAEQIENRQ